MFFFEPPFMSANRFVTRMRAEDYLLTVLAVIRLRLVPNGQSRPIEDDEEQPGPRSREYFDDGLGPSPRYGGDYAPFKPRTDVTLMGSAHVPQGNRARQLRATFGMENWRKHIDIVGDRVLHRDVDIHLTQPALFSSISLRLDNAFGGLSSPYNPWGKGFGEFNAAGGDEFPVCNLHPEGETQVRWDEDQMPAGFGPLPEDMLPRIKLRGSYNEHWLRNRNPLPPLDFDWAFYNAAPPDQQFLPYLLGNETFYFENLHPQFSRMTTRLWGQRLRVLLRRETGPKARPGVEYLEIKAPLDSVHVDTEAMTIDLAWRAVTSAQHPEAREFTHCHIATEAVDREPAPLADHVAMFEARLNGNDLPPPPPPPPPPAEADAAAGQEELDEEAMATIQNMVKELELPAELKDAVAKAKTPPEAIRILETAVNQAVKLASKSKM